MSVKTKLSLEEINNLTKDLSLEVTSIEKTSQGISDTVYILTSNINQKYILKLYENSNKSRVLNELKLLKKVNNLKVSKPLHFFRKFEKPLVLYTFVEGFSPHEIKKTHLKEIANFLKKLHSIFCKKIKIKFNSFDIQNLYLELLTIDKLDENVKKEFSQRLGFVRNVDVQKNISIIHGDIFPDNTRFIEQRLSGVFDFSEVCIASAYLDLAIVINSWCFNKDKTLNITLATDFLKQYSNSLTISFIGEYLLYVNLFYALKRYINIHKSNYDNKVSYKEYLEKFDNTFYFLNDN